MSEDRKRRAEARRANEARYPIRRFRIEEEPATDPRSETTPEVRLQQLRELSLRAFALHGKPTPRYARDQMPGRVIRAEKHDAANQ